MHFFSLEPDAHTQEHTRTLTDTLELIRTMATILIEADRGLIHLIQIYIHHIRWLSNKSISALLIPCK